MIVTTFAACDFVSAVAVFQNEGIAVIAPPERVITFSSVVDLRYGRAGELPGASVDLPMLSRPIEGLACRTTT